MTRNAALAVTILVVVSFCASGETIFRSNALGMKLSQISDSEREGVEYVLVSTTSGVHETDVLYHNGVRSTEYDRTFSVGGQLTSEEVIESGNPSRYTEYNANGLPTLERHYRNGQPTDEVRYAYDTDGRIVTAKTYRYEANAGATNESPTSGGSASIGTDTAGSNLGKPGTSAAKSGAGDAGTNAAANVPAASGTPQDANASPSSQSTPSPQSPPPAQTPLSTQSPPPTQTDRSAPVLAYTDAYSYYPGNQSANRALAGQSSGGLVQSIRRTFADNTFRESRFRYDGGALVEEWEGTTGTGTLTRYDSRGRKWIVEEWNNGAVAKRTTYHYEPGTSSPVAVQTDDLETGTATDESFADGVLTKEVVTRDGKTVSVTNLSYSSSGKAGATAAASTGSEKKEPLLLERSTTTDAGTVTMRYAYDDSGQKLTEAYLINGTLVRVTHYSSDGSYVEDRYQNGKVVLKVYYENGRRTREDLIRDGVVVQSRSVNP